MQLNVFKFVHVLVETFADLPRVPDPLSQRRPRVAGVLLPPFARRSSGAADAATVAPARALDVVTEVACRGCCRGKDAGQ